MQSTMPVIARPLSALPPRDMNQIDRIMLWRPRSRRLQIANHRSFFVRQVATHSLVSAKTGLASDLQQPERSFVNRVWTHGMMRRKIYRSNHIVFDMRGKGFRNNLSPSLRSGAWCFFHSKSEVFRSQLLFLKIYESIKKYGLFKIGAR